MTGFFDEKELQKRIELNLSRLKDDPYYRIEKVFARKDYDWYGDKEGRALLSFVSHYKISKEKIPCMEQMMAQMEERTNEKLFFGPIFTDRIHEQQLSGHSWLLRGLCEYYEQFESPFALKMIRSVCDGLYLPTKGKYQSYPVDRSGNPDGGVSGKSGLEINSWILSTDVGCAFMSIDGLSHAYKILSDPDLKKLLDEMIGVYLAIDKKALKVQTHCTLTAARGMMRMYELCGEKAYLDGAKAIYDLYTKDGGMTLSYQNANWWGRHDSWTEPCAIVDSLMLSCMLYKAEKKEEYRRTAARIYHNGLASSQRANGGAGTDTVVSLESGGVDTLHSKMYEAYFCCTMRLSEGLWYINENKELLKAQTTGKVEKTDFGVYMDGDILYAEISGADEYLCSELIEIDGHKLHPLLKYFKIPKEDMEKISQKLIF
ncbi:MAG: hypothetical protein E7646_00990 [Ruminococcaceae bacterium]|nr:hypothetical protein [Oscillospiraceae bacterium]